MARRKKRKRSSNNKGSFYLDYEDVVKDVARIQIATSHIPALVKEQIKKGWKNLPNVEAKRSPKSWMHDPLALQYSLGYKDRRFSLTYDTLKRVVGQLSIINAIINTRAAQVATFAQPYRHTKSLGFSIRHKDYDHLTTPSELEFIKELERFVLNCGRSESNPWSRQPRDDFDSFLRKVIRDTLIYDQVCHPAGTLIEKENGKWTPIEEIKVGDLVRTHKGVLKPVMELKRRDFTGNLITIKSGDQKVIATENHPFLAITGLWFPLTVERSRNIKLKWVAAKDLTKDCYLVYPKLKISDGSFLNINKPKRAGESYIQGDEYFYIKIHSISRTEVENYPVFNFEVAEDHSYIANGFVSHNCIEIVPDKLNIPFEFIAVDASTIRIASDDRYVGVNSSMHSREGFVPSTPSRFANLYENAQYGVTKPWKDRPVAYVQVINGQIENVYNNFELAFGVRNPRTDIYIQGYGYSELEQLITVVTSHLFAEQYNRNFFSQGCQPKGILNLKGDNYTQDMLEGFRRQWLASTTGVENCLCGDTIVWTKDGGKTLKDVVGDVNEVRVSIWTGTEWADGLVYKTKKKKQLCKTMLSNTSVIKSSPDHRFLVLKDRELVWKEQKALRPGDYVAIEKYNADYITFLGDKLTFEGDVNFPFIEDFNLARITAVVKTNYFVEMYDVSINNSDHIFMANGVATHNSWRMPVLQSEGLDWIDLAKSNQEMEFGAWIEYLLKISCAVYLIDPAEINFDLHGGQMQTPLFESSQEWKLKASRDRGLKPLLKFLAKLVNKNIIDKIDDHFTLEFVGLDELSEREKHELNVEKASSYMTLNEVRKSNDLPPLPGGDRPMNPVYMQSLQIDDNKSELDNDDVPVKEDVSNSPSLMSDAPKYSQNYQFDSYTEEQ